MSYDTKSVEILVLVGLNNMITLIVVIAFSLFLALKIKNNDALEKENEKFLSSLKMRVTVNRMLKRTK